MPFWKTGSPHAKARALARYGIVVDDDDMLRCVLDIISSVDGCPKAIMLMRHRPDREVWWAFLAGVEMHVVYCPDTATIVTVLPLRG